MSQGCCRHMMGHGCMMCDEVMIRTRDGFCRFSLLGCIPYKMALSWEALFTRCGVVYIGMVDVILEKVR